MRIDDPSLHKLLNRYGAQKIIDDLSSHLSEARRTRIDEVLHGRLKRIEVAIEEPYDPHNAAAVVRSAEALGAGGVHVIRAHQRVLHNKGTTAGSARWIRTYGYSQTSEFVEAIRGRGYCIAGSCLGAESTLDELPIDRPICLLFGNEHRGLSEEAREACDVLYEIPMFGFAESYNLSVSAALSLYSVAQRIRMEGGQSGDLDARRLEDERALYFLCAVDPRLVRVLFPELPAADSAKPK